MISGKVDPFRGTISVFILASLACGVLGTPSPAPDAVSTIVASTLQALIPPASPTSTPTVLPLPTSTALPPPTTSNLPAAMRINFTTGTTQNVVQGTVQAGEIATYAVRALKDQPMIAMLDSADHDLTLSIFGANGGVLLPASLGDSSWQGILPATQDYYFQIKGGGSAQFFTLNLIIAARIQFASGENTSVLNAATVGGYAVTYVVRASGGQQMDVTLNTAPEIAALTIWGFSDGQPYARAQNGVTDFSLQLPSTQDYIIQVVPQGAQVVNYKITIKVQ
jgi:hypothetical protein